MEAVYVLYVCTWLELIKKDYCSPVSAFPTSVICDKKIEYFDKEKPIGPDHRYVCKRITYYDR